MRLPFLRSIQYTVNEFKYMPLKLDYYIRFKLTN